MLYLCISPTGGQHLHTPVLYPRKPVSPEGKLLLLASAPVFVAMTQGIPLGHLMLDARGNLDPGFHGTIIIRSFLAGYQPMGTAQIPH